MVKKISSMGNLVDPFTKTLIGRVFDDHKDIISVRGCLVYFDRSML